MGGGGAGDSPLNEVVLRRIGRLADGWCPNFSPDEAGRAVMDKVRGYAQQAGRDPAALGLDGRLRTAGKQPEEWVDEVRSWEEMGANYISVETRKGGLSGADQHIDAIRRFKEQVGV